LRQLSLQLEVDSAVPAWLLFDADRVRQVLLNLVGNAIKFTTQGGAAVRVNLVSIDPVEALVELAVADTGPGISAADQARLFKPFTRLEGTRHLEGAGLGLALAHRLASTMRGTLVVESDGRTGTTFRVQLSLPIAPPPAPGAESAETFADHAGMRIVIADDNTLVRELYAAHLTAKGAICTSVADGAAALAVVEESSLPDLVLLDLAMPAVDGLEVARRLREKGFSNLRIVGLSAHGSAEYRKRALAAGMDDFLVKPVTLKELSRCAGQRSQNFRAAGPEAPPPALQDSLKAIFARETPDVLRQIEKALETDDWESLESRAHYLKNSALILDEARLAELCEWVCVSARMRQSSSARARFEEIKRVVMKF
jgi:CheY-like chemotaxis protein/anti-sigma regulatory factor (Ser/Thr protein kinase)